MITGDSDERTSWCAALSDHVGGLRVHGGVGELREHFRRDGVGQLSGVTRLEETGARNLGNRRLAGQATSFRVLRRASSRRGVGRRRRCRKHISALLAHRCAAQRIAVATNNNDEGKSRAVSARGYDRYRSWRHRRYLQNPFLPATLFRAVCTLQTRRAPARPLSRREDGRDASLERSGETRKGSNRQTSRVYVEAIYHFALLLRRSTPSSPLPLSFSRSIYKAYLNFINPTRDTRDFILSSFALKRNHQLHHTLPVCRLAFHYFPPPG